MGRMPSTQLSKNSTEIESFLYGINATNLVEPVREFTPRFKHLDTINLVKKRDVIMPVPLKVSKNERPFH